MKLIFPFILLIIISSCNRDVPEYYTTQHGLKYKYHDVSTEEETPKKGEFLKVRMQWEAPTSDSVFYDSRNYSPDGIVVLRLGKQKHLGGIEEAFSKLKKGDSVSFYISPDFFYSDYLNLNTIPEFLQNEKEMIITLRLVDILTEEEYKSEQQNEQDELELKELEAINEELKQWKTTYDSINEIEGVYWTLLERGEEDSLLRYNDVVTINYTASFLNGTVFYDTYKNGYPDEFQLGREQQMVEGLQDVLLKLHSGDKAKILVPSYRGFGSEGSKSGVVPPYTPIVYEVEVYKKEKE